MGDKLFNFMFDYVGKPYVLSKNYLNTKISKFNLFYTPNKTIGESYFFAKEFIKGEMYELAYSEQKKRISKSYAGINFVLAEISGGLPQKDQERIEEKVNTILEEKDIKFRYNTIVVGKWNCLASIRNGIIGFTGISGMMAVNAPLLVVAAVSIWPTAELSTGIYRYNKILKDKEVIFSPLNAPAVLSYLSKKSKRFDKSEKIINFVGDKVIAYLRKKFKKKTPFQ